MTSDLSFTEEEVLDVSHDSTEEIRVYKEKPYFNSDKQPFGLTLKGRSKDYIKAHEAFKELVIKNKKYNVVSGNMKFLDVTRRPSMVNALVEVTVNSVKQGNVELKLYNPNKKGATIELRKTTDFSYECVESLKVMICSVLDGILAGKEVAEVLRYLSKKNLMRKTMKRVSFKPKLFSCDKCNFETRFASALKRHLTTIHKDMPKTLKCETCEFKCDSKTNLREHMTTHIQKNKKRPKETFNCSLSECNSTFSTEEKLKEHINNQHSKLEGSISVSPTSSPPRKKTEADILDIVDNSEVEMMDIEIEANTFVTNMLEKRIKELEHKIEIDRLIKQHMKEEIKALKEGTAVMNKPEIPNHLSPVHDNHLTLLRGYRMRYKSVPDGACLANSFAVHAYEDPGEGVRVKKYLNKHIADNMEYYKNKIQLPFNETIGVGMNNKVVNITTYEELEQFFRHDDALKVFADSHEVLAIANLFNIKINIFSYDDKIQTWSQVCPDPEFEAKNDYSKWIPDLALYHSSESHYDLLVKDDSRLAINGLFVNTPSVSESKANTLEKDSLSFKQLPLKKRKLTNSSTNQNEHLLTEENVIEASKETKDDISEEIALNTSKSRGYRRTVPQEEPEQKKQEIRIFKCSKCGVELQSKGILEAHASIHIPTSTFKCDSCVETFPTKNELENHVADDHKEMSHSDEWTCNDCPFQGSLSSQLMKHLKLTSHQPNPTIKDRNSLFLDYKQCFTCKQEFDGYRNLMQHRKFNHPSNRKCRDYPEKCTRGSTCWYVHSDEMEVDNSPQKNIKCDFCNLEFETKRALMAHKKENHPTRVNLCSLFMSGDCPRDIDCWYRHSLDTSRNGSKQVNSKNEGSESGNQDFQKAQTDLFPPDQNGQTMKMFANLYQKMQIMEEKITQLMKKQ